MPEPVTLSTAANDDSGPTSLTEAGADPHAAAERHAKAFHEYEKGKEAGSTQDSVSWPPEATPYRGLSWQLTEEQRKLAEKAMTKIKE